MIWDRIRITEKRKRRKKNYNLRGHHSNSGSHLVLSDNSPRVLHQFLLSLRQPCSFVDSVVVGRRDPEETEERSHVSAVGYRCKKNGREKKRKEKKRKGKKKTARPLDRKEEKWFSVFTSAGEAAAQTAKRCNARDSMTRAFRITRINEWEKKKGKKGEPVVERGSARSLNKSIRRLDHVMIAGHQRANGRFRARRTITVILCVICHVPRTAVSIRSIADTVGRRLLVLRARLTAHCLSNAILNPPPPLDRQPLLLMPRGQTIKELSLFTRSANRLAKSVNRFGWLTLWSVNSATRSFGRTTIDSVRSVRSVRSVAEKWRGATTATDDRFVSPLN